MVKRENIFYIIFALTIILIRIEVFLFPTRKMFIDGLRVNHFWVGLVLILFILLMSKSYNILRMILFSIGFGIAADELVFILFTQRTLNDYWSIYSLAGVITILVIVFIFRKKLINKIQ